MLLEPPARLPTWDGLTFLWGGAPLWQEPVMSLGSQTSMAGGWPGVSKGAGQSPEPTCQGRSPWGGVAPLPAL